MTQSQAGSDPNFTLPSRDSAPPPSSGAARGDSIEFQRIWIGTQTRAWRTLAVVPADDGMSTYELASGITAQGLQHGESIGLADVRGLGPTRVGAFVEAVKWHAEQGQRIVFATRSITETPSTISLARAADCVILCVWLGSTSIERVKKTIQDIGKERFLGSVILGKEPAGSGFRSAALTHARGQARS